MRLIAPKALSLMLGVLACGDEEREGSGLGALVCDDLLTRAAWKHRNGMGTQGYFSHSGRDGSSPSSRAIAEGPQFSGLGENITNGQRTPAEVHGAWMNSSGHRANILGDRWAKIGFGYDACGGRPMWTEVFTSSRA